MIWPPNKEFFAVIFNLLFYDFGFGFLYFPDGFVTLICLGMIDSQYTRLFFYINYKLILFLNAGFRLQHNWFHVMVEEEIWRCCQPIFHLIMKHLIQISMHYLEF